MAPFLLDEKRDLRLALRYVEDGLESASEYAAPPPAAAHAKWAGRENTGGEPEGASRPLSVFRAAARSALAACSLPWASTKRPLGIAAFERRQDAKWIKGRRPADQALRDALKAKGSKFLTLVTLNEQMQVWVQLTGGGANQPLRIVLWADLAILNQTTLELGYHAAAAARGAPLLPDADKTVAERGGVRLRAEV